MTDLARYYDASYPPSILVPPVPPSTANITALAPSTGVVNAIPTVAVNGTGFTAATVIYIDGVAVATVYVTPTQVTTVAMNTATVGTHSVTVAKPGEQPTAARPFIVTATAAGDEAASTTPSDTTTPADTGTA